MSKKISIDEARKRPNARHVIGISGGKDSAALAIHIRNNYPEIHEKVEYFFTDTGAELEEVLDFIDNLQSYLGKPIARLSSDRPFEHWLKIHNDYLPSPRQRWCTVKLKLKPFEEFVGDDEVISYVGIRADENREGYVSQKENISAVFPFIEDGLVRDDIFQILKDTVGIPEYYKWRSRSGCFFCFFQRQDEWLGLKRNHPVLFEKAKAIEQKAGNGYTWVQGKTLDEVVAHAEEKEKEKGVIFKTNSTSEEKWQTILANMEEDDADDQACIICSL